MIKCNDIIEKIEEIAPPSLAENWDNVGLLIGSTEQTINHIFLCLDVTSETLQEAIDFNADLIVAHHPVIFTPMKRIVEHDTSGHIVRELIANNISVYCAHTNFDKAEHGMNAMLAEKFGIISPRTYTPDECKDENNKDIDNIGLVGILPAPLTLGQFIETVKSALYCPCLKYVGDTDEKISSVAVCSGGGADYLYAAYRAGADVFVTSDIKHHQAQTAYELGLNLIDAGHFETENIICDFMLDFLSSNFPELDILASSAKGFFRS